MKSEHFLAHLKLVFLSLSTLFFTSGCNTTLYWTAVDARGDQFGSEIFREKLGKDSRVAEELVSTGKWKPIGLAVDKRTGTIFWAHPDERRIKVMTLEERRPMNFPSEDAIIDYPLDVALDPTTSRIFWSAQGINSGRTGKIQYAYTDGRNNRIHDLATGLEGPAGIVIDARRHQRRIYWLNLSGKFESINIDGEETRPTNHGVLPSSEPRDLAFDPKAWKFYWPNTGHGNIRWCRLDKGSVVETGIFRENLPPYPYCLEIDHKKRKLYWSYRERGNRIERGSLEGLDRETVIEGDMARAAGLFFVRGTFREGIFAQPPIGGAAK